MVREAGGEVVEAADGVAALEAARADGIDLVFLDLNLPKASGLSVLSAIKSSAKAPRVVVITNHATDAHRRECLARGADEFLDKADAFERVADILSQTASPP